MTEVTSDPGLNFDPGQVAALREHWVSVGLDVATFDAAASGVPQEPQEPPQGVASPAVDQSEPAGDLSPQQIQEMADALLAAGVPKEEVEAALKADGLSFAAADTRTDEQREYDAGFGAGAPQDYKISYVGRAPADLGPDGLAALNEAATTWLRDMAFPTQIGPAVVERLLEVNAQLGAMTEPERRLWAAEQAYQFEQWAGGAEQAAERRASAVKALAKGRADFTDTLVANGALQDAQVLTQLALHGARLAGRWG